MYQPVLQRWYAATQQSLYDEANLLHHSHIRVGRAVEEAGFDFQEEVKQ